MSYSNGRPSVPSRPDKIRVRAGEFFPAHRNDICEDCGCYYYEHVRVPGYDYLTRLCNGDLVEI